MLPNEVENLYNAVVGGGQTQIDATRLTAELTGMAEFHRELLGNNLLTPALSELYDKHIGKFTGQVALTAPATGAPQVVVMTTAPVYGVAQGLPYQSALVECPNCHHKFVR